MDFDVQQLSAEIRRIDSEYRQANDRLFEASGRGRGRGRYRGRGRSRLGARQSGRNFIRYQIPSYEESIPETIEQPKVASSIAGISRDETQRDLISPVIFNKPVNRAIEEDPKMKDRNRRMFSSLLGTLEKFREENDSVEKSEKWKKREEIAKRAIQRTTAENLRLREQEKKDREEQKLLETERLKELDSMRKTKALQLIYAKRIQHQEAEQKQNFEKEKLKLETGEGLGDATVFESRPKIENTVFPEQPEADLSKDEDDVAAPEIEELQFQPVSEKHIPMEEGLRTIDEKHVKSDNLELPPAKKSKLNREVSSGSDEK